MILNLQERPELNTDFCFVVIVDSGFVTPPPNVQLDSDVRLLGVINDDFAARHRARIQAKLFNQGSFRIKQNDITTGPGVVISDCILSILGHAH